MFVTRTTASYASVPPFGEPIETLANGPSAEELRMRAEGTADLHGSNGVVFGVAVYRPGPDGDWWYARAAVGVPVMTRGETIDVVTKRLARKIEERRKR